jgi:hypothetical protein
MQSSTQGATELSTTTISRSLKELQDGTENVTKGASAMISRTLRELQEQSSAAVEASKQSAVTAVSQMLETHGMLRSDTTALFERLREANILLQEVLSGAHENMSEIESTLVTRVADFVAAMNDVAQKTGTANTQVEQHITAFQTVTANTLTDLAQLAGQFDVHGRSLAEAVSLIDRSNRRTEGSLGERQGALETLINTLDSKSGELDQRLGRFSGLLEKSLEDANERAREIASLISESTTDGARAIADNFEAIRASTEEQQERTTSSMRSTYQQAVGEAHEMFTQAADRFADVVEGLKRMAGEMQQELDATRSELRKGILELPQETAESAAQMRRVIVDQIEALAELNRIVARHGRGLDSVEPTTPRRIETTDVNGRRGVPQETAFANGPRIEPAPRPRNDLSGMAPPAIPPRRAESPSLSPAQTGQRAGWLSELLGRASQDAEQPANEPPSREPPREAAPEVGRSDDRATRRGIDSLDSLAVDIARMIDHDAAADLWDRYHRGERNVFTRKLYTMQGQRAFDEIRKKYRSERDFMQTVDRYIVEFERLLEEVSRDDRGQVVARTYLTSETGKVYTMLAHAAGRFD